MKRRQVPAQLKLASLRKLARRVHPVVRGASSFLHVYARDGGYGYIFSISLSVGSRLEARRVVRAALLTLLENPCKRCPTIASSTVDL